ncbi:MULTISPECIES: TraX family protein [unclassified Microcoleus]|uniref:TraX family protein n=1 Tax=unclassified Microcoleus TaxID=2642155 RepID=UPI002FCF6F26
MNQSQIKWLATILMVIDHVGFLIEAEPLRIIGRLSFPLFAWIFARNWERPGEKKALVTRLLLFGIISQVPYVLLFNAFRLNIMFSFVAIAITFQYIRKSARKILTLAISLIAAQILNTSYGYYAIICTLMMVSLKEKGSKLWWFGWSITNIIYTITIGWWYQIFAVLTPLILTYHDPKLDRKPNAIEKRFFYYFYPIHIAGLAALQAII